MEKELAVDNLKLSPAGQEQLRLRIIRVAKKHLKANGKPNVSLVAELCECSMGHVSGTWKKYAEGGISAVKAVKMGRPRDRGALTPAQQRQIRKAIVDKCPEQLKLKGFLWDREAVRDLILRRYGVKISVQAVGSYLKKWGFSPQRPAIRNYKQSPSEIREWLDVKYPAVKKRAKKENGEIMWCDETGCQNETNYVKGYAPVGKTPVLPSGNHRLRVSMISAITNQGKLRFMFYRESMNARLLIKFLDRLIRGARRKIFLVLDNLNAHRAAAVREWLETRKKKIELFFLPPYAPEYNPDEYLNGALKRSLAKKGYSVTAGELESKARGTMKNMQRDPVHIASFFKAEAVRYAA